MRIQEIGPWILLALGATSVIAGIWVGVKKSPPTGLWVMLVFGVAMAGVGIHGPLFMQPYGDFLARLLSAPTAETYKEFLEKAGKGEMPAEYREAGLALMLEKPVPELEGMLDEAIDTAPDPQGKESLSRAREDLKRKKETASRITRGLGLDGSILIGEIAGLDSSTRALVANDLLGRPDRELSALNLRRSDLQKISGTREP